MSIVNLAELKAHLNVDIADDDAMLQAKLEAAESYVAEFVGGPIDDATLFPDGTPAPLKLAVTMLAGHWYDNREPVSLGERVYQVPLNVMDLINLYRVWSF